MLGRGRDDRRTGARSLCPWRPDLPHDPAPDPGGRRQVGVQTPVPAPCSGIDLPHRQRHLRPVPLAHVFRGVCRKIAEAPMPGGAAYPSSAGRRGARYAVDRRRSADHELIVGQSAGISQPSQPGQQAVPAFRPPAPGCGRRARGPPPSAAAAARAAPSSAASCRPA